MKEMLRLRRAGWSFLKLAARYRVDHSSIIWQVKKHDGTYKPKLVYRKKYAWKTRDLSAVIPIRDVSQITDEDRKKGVTEINQGRNYRDYIKEIRKKGRGKVDGAYFKRPGSIY